MGFTGVLRLGLAGGVLPRECHASESEVSVVYSTRFVDCSTSISIYRVFLSFLLSFIYGIVICRTFAWKRVASQRFSMASLRGGRWQILSLSQQIFFFFSEVAMRNWHPPIT